MVQKTPGGKESSALDATVQAIKRLEATLGNLVEEGDADGVLQAAGKLRSVLGLSDFNLSSSVERARKAAEEHRLRAGRELHDAADKAECEAKYSPPFAQVGCVILNERQPGQWAVSVLDDVVLGTIRTWRGRQLADHAVRIVKDIESTLDKWQRFPRDLATTLEAAGASATNPVGVNHLMVLCSFGGTLRRSLTLGVERGGDRILTRAQFGFLLSAVVHRVRGDPEEFGIRLLGATQHDTRHPHQFIAVPDVPDPRRIAGHRLVKALAVTRGAKDD